LVALAILLILPPSFSPYREAKSAAVTVTVAVVCQPAAAAVELS